MQLFTLTPLAIKMINIGRSYIIGRYLIHIRISNINILIVFRNKKVSYILILKKTT